MPSPVAVIWSIITNNNVDVNNKHRSIKDHTECGVSLGCDNATVLYTSNTRYGSTGDHIHHLYRGGSYIMGRKEKKDLRLGMRLSLVAMQSSGSSAETQLR